MPDLTRINEVKSQKAICNVLPNRQFSNGRQIEPYTQMALVELIRRVVWRADVQALCELHENRPLFRHQNSQPLLLVDFLVRLKQWAQSRRWCQSQPMVLEQAFDQTLAKFLNIPGKNELYQEPTETLGPDCRYYYRAYYYSAT